MLGEFFRGHRALGPDERSFVAETVFALLRHKRSLEAVAQGDARRLILAALVRARGFSLRELAGAVSIADERWLRSLKSATAPDASLAHQLELPDWIAERLVARFGEAEALSLGRALLESAPLDLRVNSLKSERAQVLAELAASGIEAAPTRFAPAGVRLAGKPALQRHPLFLAGAIEVQDEASQLVCHLMAPRRGEMVVDFCAGAGGKTLALAALMRSGGRVYAFDVSERRLANLAPRLARSGASNVHPQRIANERDPRISRLAAKIDRVLVDVPCSGLGTLRRNPDLKWRQQAADIDELRAKQGAILASAARLVKPGGRLVYATCSLLAEENEAIVGDFLKPGGFELLDAGTLLAQQGIVVVPEASDQYLRLLPHEHHTDGFFAAAMQRR